MKNRNAAAEEYMYDVNFKRDVWDEIIIFYLWIDHQTGVGSFSRIHLDL